MTENPQNREARAERRGYWAGMRAGAARRWNGRPSWLVRAIIGIIAIVVMVFLLSLVWNSVIGWADAETARLFNTDNTAGETTNTSANEREVAEEEVDETDPYYLLWQEMREQGLTNEQMLTAMAALEALDTETEAAAAEATAMVAPGTPGPSVTPQPSASGDCQPRSYRVFNAAREWDSDEMAKQNKPTFEEFLTAHGLSRVDIQPYNAPVVSWEPAMYVVELDESLYGVQRIPLLEGWQYTAALCDGTVQVFWGGDPNVTEVQLQWGFTARWVEPYLDLPYKWLDPENPTELLVRENRFGRYRRSPESRLPGLPYFDRYGPYQTLSGNVSDWQPPALDAVQPHDYRDATAMLGGLAVESEWTTDGTNWSWRYSHKVAGSGDYCPQGMPCWQTTYIPGASTGYIELWDGALGGPRKFYATDLATLVSGQFNVDEFSYHPFGD